MTLNTYIEQLIDLVKKHPTAGDMTVLYSTESTIDNYLKIYGKPSLAQIDNIRSKDMEFIGIWNKDDIEYTDCNAVIVN